MVTREGTRRLGWALPIGLALALALVTALVFAPAGRFDFVSLDDPAYVSENVHVAGGLTMAGLAWAFTSAHAGYWLPLVWLSYMVDVEFFGTGAGPHHLVNIALHIANTLLLFWLLFRTTGAAGRSGFVAALFALHPLHVESVAWITERKDVLSTLFWMGTLLAYVAYARRPGRRRYAAVLLLFTLGLLAKPMLVTLPFVLLLLDVWPLGRLRFGAAASTTGHAERRGAGTGRVGALVVEKLPLFALAGVASAIAFVAQRQQGAVNSLQAVPLGLRVENALRSYVAYIGKMLWPAQLSPLYPLDEAISPAVVAGAALLLAALTALALYAVRRRPYVTVGWFWYLGTLVPVIGLVQVGVQGMADRFTYVPLVGLFIIAAWGGAELAGVETRPGAESPAGARRSVGVSRSLADQKTGKRWRHLQEGSPPQPLRAGTAIRRIVLAALAVALSIGCAVSARAQLGYWKDSVTFWTRATELTLRMDTYHAHLSLGGVLRGQGRVDEALQHYAEATRLQPASAEARYEYGVTLIGAGRTAEAVAALSEAVRLQPGVAVVHGRLGEALAAQGRNTEAIAEYREAVRLDPALAEAHNNLGAILAPQGQLAEALQHFAAAVRARPDFVGAHLNYGVALAQAGNTGSAVAEFREVLRLDPANQQAGRALEELGRRP